MNIVLPILAGLLSTCIVLAVVALGISSAKREKSRDDSAS
jgi:hypothetical protein